MTVIRVIVALMLLPWLILLGGAVAFIQIIDGSFFEGEEDE